MITATDNPKVKQARALLARRGRAQQGHCLAEGARLIEDAMRAGIRPALILFAPAAQDSERVVALLDQARAARIPTYEVSPAIFEQLSDTVTPQGVIAVLPIPAIPPPPEPGLILVLDQVRDPGNLGTILRSAEASGVESVLLTTGCVDPWSPKVLRAAMGAHFRLPLQAGRRWPEIADLLHGRSVLVADATGDRVYDEVDWTQNSALIVGSEATGPSREAAALSSGTVAIPMPGGAESLNVAMATTVLLFEAARQRRVQGARP